MQKLESEVVRITNEYKESQVENQAYQQREFLMLDYSQKLIDKTLQIQVENKNIQESNNYLKNNQKHLYLSIHQLLLDKTVMGKNLFQAENELKIKSEKFALFISKIILQNRMILQCLCDLQGEHLVLRKKYETIIRNNNRKLNMNTEVC